MNISRLISLSRSVQSAGFVAALMLASAGAHAGGGVYWSVNVGAPMHGVGYVSTAVSNAPRGVYTQAPVVYAPAPVVYSSPRVVYAPRQVVYSPPVVVQSRPFYAPAPVVYYPAPRRCDPRDGWRERPHHHRGHDDRYARSDDWRDGGERDHGDRGWRHER